MTMLGRASRYWRETSGAAAAEFAIWLLVLVPLFLNAVDLGAYVYQRMQVQNAAQMAVQAAWKFCDEADLACDPTTQVDAAIASTSLGTEVTRSGAVTTGQYCPNNVDNTLTPGATCGSVDAGYYVLVTVTYTYQPIFPGITVGAALAGPITQTAWSRYA